jgi:hypothetical protein
MSLEEAMLLISGTAYLPWLTLQLNYCVVHNTAFQPQFEHFKTIQNHIHLHHGSILSHNGKILADTQGMDLDEGGTVRVG